MRITRIIARLNTGGPALQVINLHRELKLRGHDCRILAGFVPHNEQRDLENEISEEVDFIPELGRDIGFCDLKAFNSIRAYLLDFRPDIVHTHTAKAGFLGRLAAMTISPRPKLIHTFHGHVFYGYFGWVKSKLFLEIEKALSKRTDKVISVGHALAEELKRFGIRNLITIPLGFDLSELIKTEVNFNKIYNIGIVGRLTQIKNHELFFCFMDKLAKKIKVKAWIIGEGERKKELQEMVKDYSFPCKFISVPHQKISQVYQLLDIAVCSSKNEGTPVSLIEAMASGCLVISTDVGGVRDLLGSENEKRGFILNPENIGATIDEIEMILKKPGDFKDILLKARNYVIENYDLKILVDRIEKLYKEVLEK